jgi:hypothetical protein
LRIAVYELLEAEIPPKVAINEAVELAKMFGSEFTVCERRLQPGRGTAPSRVNEGAYLKRPLPLFLYFHKENRNSGLVT